jgi:tungstate transport system substrate-binding protein
MSLDLATTASVRNSGLLGAVIPSFPNAMIHVHATGSGPALEMLADEVIDVALTHAPDSELRYLAAHPDWNYRKFAYNQFVIVGPTEDPADVRHAVDAVDAFRRIAASPMTFVSRGDGSGTHEREQALWHAAGKRPQNERHVISGSGMAEALFLGYERQGYVLSDVATYLHHKPRLDLVVLKANDPRLMNTYAVVYRRSNALAERFAKWLTEGDGGRQVAQFRIGEAAAFMIWPRGCPDDKPNAQPCL